MPLLAFDAFEERCAAQAPPPPSARGKVAGADGTDLAYALYEPPSGYDDLLIFYHGGGVNMRAGYDRLAAALVAQASSEAGAPLAVCLTDIRGHGASGGPRGHARRRDLPLQDVETLVARMLSLHPGARLWLGGHSSGAGLLLNALSRGWPRTAPAGLLLLAPNFGYHAALDRNDAAFGGAAFWPFVVNWFTSGRIAGGMPAVRLDFSRSRGAQALGCVSSYTVNMALAVTPNDPGGQLARLRLPIWVGLAGADEIMDPDKVEAFLARHAPAAAVERLPGSSHLGILLDAAPAMTATMRRLGLDAVRA